MIRQIVITNTITNEKWAMQFNPVNVSDSESLHYLLCDVDPGEVYTVAFTSEVDDLLPAKCLYSA